MIAAAGLAFFSGAARGGEHYVILTTNAAYNECHAAIDDFVVHKETQGYEVLVKTESDWAGSPGAETADQVRNYLITGEESWGATGIDYLLIIADAEDVPMKVAEIYPGLEVPTDWYYADLDGDWDLDGDGVYAEYDSDVGPGGVDFEAEASVGRIIYKEETLPAILERIIAHQENMYDGALDQGWRYRVLQAGAFLEIEPDGTVLDCGSAPQEYIYDHYIDGTSFSSLRLYDPGNAWTDPSPNIAEADGDLDAGAMYAELESFGYGTVIWQAHGGTDAAYRRLNQEYLGEIQTDCHTPFVDTADPGDLAAGSPVENNPDAPVIVAASCHNGSTDPEALAAAFMDSFAVNFVGSDVSAQKVLGWDEPEDGGMQGWSVYMAEQLLSARLPVGDAFAAAIAEYYAEALDGDPGNAGTKNCYCMTVYGDPSLRVTIEPWTELATILFGGAGKKGFFADEKSRYRFRDEILAYSKDGIFLTEALYRQAATLARLAAENPRLWKGMVETEGILRKIAEIYFAGGYGDKEVPLSRDAAGRIDSTLKDLQAAAPKELGSDVYRARKILAGAAGKSLRDLKSAFGFGQKRRIPEFCLPAR